MAKFYSALARRLNVIKSTVLAMRQDKSVASFVLAKIA